MSAIVRMPALAAGSTEAAIQTWLVAVGDPVVAGQPIVEIETEKAVVEHEAEQGGTLAAILLDAGVGAPVGTPIAILATDGESAEQAVTHAGPESGAVSEVEAAPAQPVVEVPAPSTRLEGSDAHGTSDGPIALAISPDGDGGGRRLFASPLVRRLARERGIDLASVRGSGPQGRIVRRDLEHVATAPVGASAATPTTPATASVSPPASADHTDVPHTGMRRAIARRLTESTSTVPHFFLVADCRMDEVLALRARINDTTGVKVSVNDFVIAAVAAAMGEVPDVNAIWTDDAVRRFDGVDVAVAVSVPGGLVTPVLRAVEKMRLGEISAAVRDLAARGRAGRLKQGELEGGSFSVSNLGMYGTREFSAIINPPHSGILAVGAAEKRPIVDEAGGLAVATLMTVTLSADHRVLDGALAAQWLAAFVRRIENPLGLLV